MNTLDIGRKLVKFSNEGRSDLAVAQLYGDTIASIESDSTTTNGIEGVQAKHAWWDANHEVHVAIAEGPYLGHRPDQFVVKFCIDLTPRGAAREQFTEIAIYTVDNQRIVKEEFLPLQAQ
jgi:hypothetical protein